MIVFVAFTNLGFEQRAFTKHEGVGVRVTILVFWIDAMARESLRTGKYRNGEKNGYEMSKGQSNLQYMETWQAGYRQTATASRLN